VLGTGVVATRRGPARPRTIAAGRPLLGIVAAILVGVAAAVFEVVLARWLPGDIPRPHLVLVAAVVMTVARGFGSGAAAAIAGGVALDAIAFRTLGVSAAAVLVSSSAVAAAASGLRGPARVLAVSLVAPASVLLGLLGLLSSAPALALGGAVANLAPAATLDVAAASAFGLPILLLPKRRVRAAQ
jgi:cell shape-determining protein MreD